MRLLVLRDVLLALKDFSAMIAAIFVGRHGGSLDMRRMRTDGRVRMRRVMNVVNAMDHRAP